jgi:hypothetical protein
MAIAGGIATLAVYLLISYHDVYKDGHFWDEVADNLGVVDWIMLMVLGVMVSICLVGVFNVRSRLLRAGFLLQAGSLVTDLFFFVFRQYWDTYWETVTGYYPNFPPNFSYQWTFRYLPLILTALNAVSLVVLSYGLVRWQRGQDTWFTPLQVIVSGVASYLFFNAIHLGNLNGEEFFSVGNGSPFIAVAVTLFAASVFLLRPACWKQQRMVTLLLGMGVVLFIEQASEVDYPFGDYLFEWFRSPLPLTVGAYYRVLYSTYLLAWILLLLGFLLLIQTERVRRKAQQAAAPALARQKP